MEQNQNVVEYEKVKTSKLAIVALLIGGSSIVLAIGMGGFYLGIPGIIVSIIAIAHVKRNYLEGEKLAKAGLITSVIGLIGSIVLVALIAGGLGSLRNSMEKEWDVEIAGALASSMDWLYIGPYEEELPEVVGKKYKICEGAVVPDCVEECLAPLWSDNQLHGPSYTENGAFAYVIELGETECEAVYITNGVEEWQVYPVVDEEYE